MVVLCNYSVDRIEGNAAVLVDDDGRSVSVPVSQLPEAVVAGDILSLKDGVYSLNTAETEVRRAHALSLQNKLRRKNK